jgi:peptidyl-prolyl cis-trans isomerase SurA
MGLKVDAAKVNEVIQRIAKENGFHSTQALYAEIKHRGLSDADYREEIRQELLMQTLQQSQVGAKITITPKEVTDFMRTKSWETSDNKEYHIQNILLSLPDTPSTQQIQATQHRANTLLDAIHHDILSQIKIPRSNKIAAVAAHFGLAMGDLGWRKLSEVPSAFAASVQHMQAGDVIGPIQTSNGFHILYLVETRSTTKAQNTTTQQIEQWIYQRKMEEALQHWIMKLRSQASIQKEES